MLRGVMRGVVLAAALVAIAVPGNLANAEQTPQLRTDDQMTGPSSNRREVQMTRLLETAAVGRSDRARVELVLGSLSSADAVDLVEQRGGAVIGESPGVLLVEMPTAGLESIAVLGAGAVEIRLPARVDLIPDAQGSTPYAPVNANQLLSVTNAAAWHVAGHVGQGVKVGVIDYFDGAAWALASSAGAVPFASGTFCRSSGFSCDVWSAGSPHGVAVAEIIHTMAPGAEIYLATASTTTDLAAAVAWLDAQGVTVISRSLGSVFDSAGNGTGTINAVVADAVSRGMVWFNAAGNAASASGTAFGSYWRGSWVDADGDGWLDFAPGDETLGLLCGGIQGFRWSDWSGNATDYDVYLSDASRNVIAQSLRDQGGGATPLEMVDFVQIDCETYPIVYLSVNLWTAGNGTAGDVLEFLANQSQFEYSQNPYSIAGPVVDSTSSGLVAVGAIDPGNGTTIAPYSSRGPTNDGRIKPNLSAPSCIASVVYAPDCFNGTSAAAPVAAGAAALVRSAEVASTPSAIRSYLVANVIDRGAPGADTTYGAGQLHLGEPPHGNASPVAVGDGPYALSPGGTVIRGAPGVLANDIDPDAGTLTAVKVSDPVHGTVTLGGDGAFTYVHNGDAAPTDSFTYRASDGSGALSNVVQVRFTIGAQPPSTLHTTGLVDTSQGRWYLYSDPGWLTYLFYFGNPGDYPIFGDWDCDGVETPGMYRQSDGYVYLRNSNTQGPAEIRFFFGNPGDVPVAGDFDGDGCATVSIYRPSNQTFYIINALGANDGGLGAADFAYVFGDPGDKPFVGDFDGDGVETVGLHRESTGLVYFRNSHTQGNADVQFIFGDPGDRMVAGDWNADGVFTPGLFRPSDVTMFFRYTNSQGVADNQFVPSPVGSTWLPVSGLTD